MTYEQIMERHKIRSDVSDLNEAEREVYESFLELAVTERDVDILSRAWLKHHRKMVMAHG